MPNNPRQFEIGDIYHVLNRGYEKRNIFLDKFDYLRFIESLFYFNDKALVKVRDARKGYKLEYALQHTGQTGVLEQPKKIPLVDILSFVLMPNHYHLILQETTSGGISKFMQKIGNGYSGYFNEKYSRERGMGGIFQGRYKSVPVKNDMQLTTVFAYVHTNPVELIEPKWKDFIVKDKQKTLSFLDGYKWSSFHDYAGKETFPEVTERKFFLEFFGGNDACKKVIEDWIKFKAQNVVLGSEIIDI